MLSWIIQMSVISLVLIILIHYLFTFFKTNLTIPKVKDLVNKPQEQYEMLFNTIKNTNTIQAGNKIGSGFSTNPIANNNVKTNQDMKTELKNYLKELSDSNSKIVNNNNDTNINNTISGNNNSMNQNTVLTSDNLLTSDAFASSIYSAF
jgi:hypothetical protein